MVRKEYTRVRKRLCNGRDENRRGNLKIINRLGHEGMAKGEDMSGLGTGWMMKGWEQ